MNIDHFDFSLSSHLIAHYPSPERSASRLLCLDKKNNVISHRRFHELIDILSPNDMLVFNDTRVIPARLLGIKSTGGKVEVLIERILSHNRALASVRSNKPLQEKTILLLEGEIEVSVVKRHNDHYELHFHIHEAILPCLEKKGRIPLPPYIQREAVNADQERYQTVYARQKGAIAAPTAGLHFDQALLETLKKRHIKMAFVTLHVGSGTFQPVRVENIKHHKMHSEYIDVSDQTCQEITRCRENGGHIIAVGTTTVRALETASLSGQLKAYQGETNIFIYPGYCFKSVDGLITNFHLPKSTLLMLVCAFGGYESVIKAYQEAIKEQYRFYSYGDAMFLI